jgi:hypothetical protein
MYSEKFKAYKEDVVAAFLQKRQKADESWLVQLNRRKIWERSIELIENGVQSRDHRALSDYLEMKADDRDYLRAIKAKDSDYFQGLLQFLNNTNRNPADSTVEFLSWLIDFPARPYSEYIKPDANIQPEPITPPLPTGQGGAPVVKPYNRRLVDPLYLWISGLCFLFLFAGLVWWFWPKNDCMYWNDDHYVESPCSAPQPDAPLIALDRTKLLGFRRIKKIDTLSSYAVGKFWYARISKDSLEVFTARGVHPVYPNKELKKVTDYIVIVCNPHYQHN